MKTGKSTICAVFAFLAVFAVIFASCDQLIEPELQGYTIRFDANGGSGTVPGQKKVPPGTILIFPDGAGLVKTGFTFGGWNTEEDGTGKNYRVGQGFFPVNDITLYAMWNVGAGTIYTVSFDINGGTGMTPLSQDVASGSSIILPSGSGLTNAGFTFGGWNTNAAGTGSNYTAGQSYTPSGSTTDITLYAKWNDDVVGGTTFTVTFNANGGTPAPEAQSNIDPGEKVTQPPAMTRAGYTFGGWYKEPALTNQWVFSTDTVTADITLHAKWIVTYTVTFDANGGTGTMTGQSFTYGSGQNLITNTFTRADYTFAGWATSPDGPKVYNNEQPVNNLTTTAGGTVILYAVWSPVAVITYTVTFESNGGSSVESATVGLSSTVARPTDPTRNGYTFDNWYSDAGLTAVYNFSALVTADITLYAKWNPVVSQQYTVTFESNGGSNVVMATVGSGDMVARPTDPTRSGYIFVDWYGDAGLATVYDFSTPVTDNITLYAKWNATYTVTFQSNGGSNVAMATVGSGSTVARPTNPTQSGYTFDDWYSDVGLATVYDFSTPVTANLTLYAKWNIVQYTVTFDAGGATGTPPEAMTVNAGVEIFLPNKGLLVLDGSTFVGWTDTDGDATYNPGDVYMPNGDITLYAEWEPEE